MKTPNSTLELAGAVESLVASYTDSVRDAAQQAVERATTRPVASRLWIAAGAPTRSMSFAQTGDAEGQPTIM